MFLYLKNHLINIDMIKNFYIDKERIYLVYSNNYQTFIRFNSEQEAKENFNKIFLYLIHKDNVVDLSSGKFYG